MAKKNYMSKNSLVHFWQILKDTFAKKTDLSTVATSGSYDDLSNKPTIPTKNSQLTNDSGFITNEKEIFIGNEQNVPAEAKIIIDPTDIGTSTIFKDNVPINTIFEYDGDEVPDGYEEVEDKGEIYSTEEVKIGTWINGKPLYRKVFSANATSKEFSIFLEECVIISARGIAHSRYHNWWSIPTIAGESEYNTYLFFNENRDTARIVLRDFYEINASYEIVIEYIKTTD